MAAKPRPGRPRIPARQKRTRIKEVAYNEDEWKRLQILRGSEKLATYIRRKSLGEI